MDQKALRDFIAAQLGPNPDDAELVDRPALRAPPVESPRDLDRSIHRIMPDDHPARFAAKP
jgi:hypothetical protein